MHRAVRPHTPRCPPPGTALQTHSADAACPHLCSKRPTFKLRLIPSSVACLLRPLHARVFKDFTFTTAPGSTLATGIGGWADDTAVAKAAGAKNGSATVTVQFRVVGTAPHAHPKPFSYFAPHQATMPRPDVPAAHPAVPDPNHGFHYVSIPAELMVGQQTFTLVGHTGGTKCTPPACKVVTYGG
jgi:hypothetical protein